MATKKFAGPSPYSTQTNSYPPEDSYFTEFLNNVTTNHKVKTKAEPVVGALFGMGRAGAIHIASIINNPRIVLKYIVDEQTSRFADIKKYWNISDDVTFITPKEADKVYSDKAVNVVFVVSPTFTHYDIVMKSVAAGKDVFCEKPICETIEETRQCYEAAKAKGRTLYVAFNRRWDPAYRNVKERVRKGDVGHIQIIKLTTRDCPLPNLEYLKISAGMCHDLVVHDIDVACWVLGEVPTRVQVSASAMIPEIKAVNDIDTIAYMMTFPSGAIALGDSSRYSTYGFDQRLEVFGNKGMIKIENERPNHSVETIIGHEGVKYTPIFYSFPSRNRVGYKDELEHFLNVVQDGVPMDVTSYQCLAVSKITAAVAQSAKTGEIVHLDWSEDDIPTEYSP